MTKYLPHGPVVLARRAAFGRRVRDLRSRLGYSQSAMGRLIGFKQHDIAKVERGDVRMPTVDALLRAFPLLVKP